MNILGINYKINYIDDGGRNDPNMGCSDTKMLYINIKKSLPKENQILTLLHEVIHIVDDMLLLEMKEKQITALASGLYQIVKSNQWFLDENCNIENI
jgi:Zn-dependent peptidase ImmA (M78 family)